VGTGHKYLGHLPHMTHTHRHSRRTTQVECLKNIYLDGKIQKESISGPIMVTIVLSFSRVTVDVGSHGSEA